MDGFRRFRDRSETGRLLAERLLHHAGHHDVLVLALPRGGVPVGAEVARRFEAPLDVFLVRKLGIPRQEELAMGAIASGGIRVLDEDVIQALAIPEALVEEVARRESSDLRRWEEVSRGDRPPPDVRGKVVILVDDGLATGSSMRAAAIACARQGPARVVIAVPVAPPETVRSLAPEVDEVVCLLTPEPFFGVGAWYEDFRQLDDEDVRAILEQVRAEVPAHAHG